MKRLGVMGCGTVADYGHLPAIAATTGITVTALYDPAPEQLTAMQQRHQVPQAFTDVDAFMRSGIDAVVITSPAPCHLQNIRDAARYGKHILCEKPLGVSGDDIHAMMALTRDAGVMLFTAFDYRFSPVSLQIRDLVRRQAIGEVRLLRLIYIWHLHGKYTTGPDGQRILNPRREGRMEEGGPLVDCGVHQIDLARFWLQSEVTRWTASGAWVDEYEAPDHAYLHLDHACGAHTMVEMSYAYCHTVAEPITDFTYELIGTDGLIRYDRNAHIFEIRTPVGTRQLPFAGEKNFAGMYAAFADALEHGYSNTLPTAEDGLAATVIAREATDHLIAGHMAHR